MSELTREEWDEIGRRFREPFDPKEVDFRIQSGTRAIAYIDARTAQDRLDMVVGPGNWSFVLTPLRFNDKGEMILAKGSLTVHGVTKEDIGDDSNVEKSKGTASDTLKRCAVHFGVGRYLYNLGVFTTKTGQNNQILPAEITRLRAGLPKPGESPNKPFAPALEQAVEDAQQTTKPTEATASTAQPTLAPSQASEPAAAALNTTPPRPAKPTDLGLQPATEAQIAQIKANIVALPKDERGPAIGFMKAGYFSHIQASNSSELYAKLTRDDAERWIKNWNTWLALFRKGTQSSTPASPVAPVPTPPTSESPTPVHEMPAEPTVPEVDAPEGYVLPVALRMRPTDEHSPSRNGDAYARELIGQYRDRVQHIGVMEDGQLLREPDGSVKKLDYDDASRHIIRLVINHLNLTAVQPRPKIPGGLTFDQMRQLILLLEARVDELDKATQNTVQQDELLAA